MAANTTASGTSTPEWLTEFCESSSWELSKLENLSLTGMTPCFENTVLRGAVNIAFLLLLTRRVWQLTMSTRASLSGGAGKLFVFPAGTHSESAVTHYQKMISCLVCVLVPLLAVNGMAARNGAAPYELVTEPLTALQWLFCMAVLQLEYSRFVSAGRWILPFLWLFALAGDAVRTRTQQELSQGELNTDYFFALHVIGLVAKVHLVLMGYFARASDIEVVRRIKDSYPDQDVELDFALRVFDPDNYGAKGKFLPDDESEEDKKYPRNPELAANVLSRAFFSWMTPLIRLGAKQPIEAEHVWRLPRRYRTATISASFDEVWAAEQRRQKPTLLHAFHVRFGPYFYRSGLWLLLQNVFQYIPPVLLQSLIRSVALEDAKPLSDRDYTFGYLLALAMFGCFMAMTICENQYFDMVIKTGLELRAALVSSIYRKALRLSNKSRQERSTGAITNHMATDTEKLQLQVMMLHNLWSSPMRIIVGMYLLWDGLGPAVVAGVVLLMLMTPLQIKVMGYVARLMKKQFVQADSRIKIMNEILAGMRVIKYYAWESAWLKKVSGIREAELGWLKKIALGRGWALLLIRLNPVVLAVGTFAAFAVISDTGLTPETAFFALSLFNLLFWPIMLLPRTIASVLETNISLKRVEDYLMCEELPASMLDNPVADGAASAAAAGGAGTGDGAASTSASAVGNASRVIIKDGIFSWGEAPILKNINLDIPHGQLVAVIGATGAGKSSLVSALLREMDLVEGSVTMEGSVAYVPQQAWIYNATVRENILFGLPFEPERYWTTVALSALEKDFEQFDDGDHTEIGEKGINLSGGQRQRVSLARAVYAQSDVYLFDDPLSALDAKVGARVFHNCIGEGLKGRTRVLVTNQLQFLHACDRVVVIKDNTIVEQGGFEELMKQGGEMHRMMAEFSTEDDDGSDGSDGEGGGKEEDDGALTPRAAGRRAQAKVAAFEAKKAAAGGGDDGHLIEKEEREVGGIAWAVYKAYINASGGMCFLFALLVMYVLGEVSSVFASFWLGVWSTDGLKDDQSGESPSVGFYMAIYFVLSVGQSLFSAASSFVGALGSVAASRNLHAQLLFKILRAPMRWFDGTPLGRIINRFTKDMSQVDTQLMFNVSLFLGGTVKLLSTLILIGVVSPYAIMSFVPIMCVFWFVQRYFRATSRELKRLDSISRSPVYAHFTESLDGMTSIRAYRAQERMYRASAQKLDANQSIYLVHMTTNRWLSIRLEALGGLMMYAAAAFALVNKQPAELVGLSLSYALSITTQLNMMVRMSTETENSFNAVERVESYGNMEEEAPAELPENEPPAGWPEKGAVKLDKLVMSYRPDRPPVLKGISIDIKPGEKIGVAGRTGAGKSTLFQALFRIAEASSGSVTFDGKDIAELGLNNVRRAVSIIPQEPVLFSGTVRFNLDPFDEYDDAALWSVLDKAQMAGVVSSNAAKLNMTVAEGGANFSVGQRQLFCLARALLRPSRILVVDEATANVDMETDALIQKTIRENFADRTTLTIAHRLNTIIDSDRILILDHGTVKELGTPKALLSDAGSEFSSMVEETGPANAAHLRKVAMGEVDAAADAELETRARRASVALAGTSRLGAADSAVHAGQRLARGPKGREFEAAVDTALDAVDTRHHDVWKAELQATGVPHRVWLGHMYRLLDELNQAAVNAAVEDEFVGETAADSAVSRLGMGDSHMASAWSTSD